MEEFSRDKFVKHLNGEFQIFITADKASTAELIEVTESRERFGGESFSIVFLAPADAPLEQQIYTVKHQEMGTFELFLVPVGRDDKGVKYEAVFNLLSK
jgi:hypothetical protein